MSEFDTLLTAIDTAMLRLPAPPSMIQQPCTAHSTAGDPRSFKHFLKGVNDREQPRVSFSFERSRAARAEKLRTKLRQACAPSRSSMPDKACQRHVPLGHVQGGAVHTSAGQTLSMPRYSHRGRCTRRDMFCFVSVEDLRRRAHAKRQSCRWTVS